MLTPVSGGQTTQAGACYFVLAASIPQALNLAAAAEVNGVTMNGWTLKSSLPTAINSGYYIYTATGIWFGYQ